VTDHARDDAAAREAAIVARAAELAAADLEAFRYAVAHDLKFPLRVIDGFSRALEEDYAPSLAGDGLSYLASIRRGVVKLETMVARLDELLRIASTPLELADLDLSALAREVVDQVRPRHAHPVAVEIADHLTVRADRRLAELALTALLDNAFKFTGRAAAATVTVGRDPARDAVFVRDNGTGFDASAARLFSPFRRLHAAADFPGDGVGLALAHRIVRRHGGRPWAASRADHTGATLWFTFAPVAP